MNKYVAVFLAATLTASSVTTYRDFTITITRQQTPRPELHWTITPTVQSPTCQWARPLDSGYSEDVAGLESRMRGDLRKLVDRYYADRAANPAAYKCQPVNSATARVRMKKE